MSDQVVFITARGLRNLGILEQKPDCWANRWKKEKGVPAVFNGIPGTWGTLCVSCRTRVFDPRGSDGPCPSFMSNPFPSEEPCVWSDAEGMTRGVAIEPLYEGVTEAIRTDEDLYKLLVLADVIRVGKVRERKVAIEELKKTILHEPSKEHHVTQSDL